MSISFTKPLSPALFDDIARGHAERVASADRSVNKATQLRRFYDEIVMWETRVSQQPPEKFADFLPLIRMLNAKAAYAQGRKLVDTTFSTLLQETLKEVKDSESMTHCKHFWEAFTGFYKLQRSD